MVDVYTTVLVISLIILSINIVLLVAYLVTVIFVRQFHTATNVIIGNLSLCALLCSMFWETSNVLSGFYSTISYSFAFTCIFTTYFPTLFNALLVHSSVLITIHRFFLIIYPNKRLFKKPAWPRILIAIQWLVTIIFTLPSFFFTFRSCVSFISYPFWPPMYNLLIIVILPSILNGFVNAWIFLEVRSSSRRVHALATTSSAPANPNQQNNRDLRLLKHMLFIFVIFIIGWAPIYILVVIDVSGQTPYWFYLLLQMLAVFCFLIDAVNLFLYDRELRKYVTRKILNCIGLNRN